VKSFLFCFLILFAVVPHAFAGTNGILEGIIKDKKTNEKIPGVTILIVGTPQGSTTNADGYYQVQTCVQEHTTFASATLATKQC
jgi:hypothetical protein